MAENPPNDGDPPGLECPACGRTYDAAASEPWRCRCGSPLEVEARAGPAPTGDPPSASELDTGAGLWAFEPFLPVERRVTLGEGFTPLVDAPAWDATFKLEYVFPTGSFKDRGAATTLSRAADLGVETVLEDSSGNAGAAVATYAARGGIDARIFVPADAKPAKVAAIERTGAELVRVEGSREAVTDACIEAVEAGEGWYASHAYNPAFYAGTATFALEVAAQRDWTAPDAVVTPLGHGTLFLGAYRGFRALREAGWIDELPRLLGAQAAGYAPIADELHGDAGGASRAADAGGENTVADGIQIRDPAREDEIHAAIEASDGDAIALEEAPVADELDRLHRSGFYTEPTCAVAPAALRAYRRRGVLAEDADVVVALTGSGLKSG